MRIRVSVTDLDAYRYLRSNDDADFEAFLAQMRREGEATEAMKAGRAFHEALEVAANGDHGTLQADGYTFEIGPDVTLAVPKIREIKATKLYQIGDTLVTLVGKVDAVSGRTIYDHKLTGRFDPERFLAGYQWRAYLDMFEADRFVWNVFEGRADREGIYRINHVHEVPASRYPGMASDLVREIAGFVDMAETHLPTRFEQEAA